MYFANVLICFNINKYKLRINSQHFYHYISRLPLYISVITVLAFLPDFSNILLAKYSAVFDVCNSRSETPTPAKHTPTPTTCLITD